MQDFIFRVNIAPFQRLIADEADQAKRDRLERMLVEEQEKLQAYRAHLDSLPSHDRTSDGSSAQRS